MNHLPTQIFVEYGLPFIGANLFMSIVITGVCFLDAGFRKDVFDVEWWQLPIIMLIFMLIASVVWPYVLYYWWTKEKVDEEASS